MTFVVNFSKEFVEPILAGRKRQTIRAERKDFRRPKIGEPIALYTGLRTLSSRLLGNAPCEYVSEVVIDFETEIVLVAGATLTPAELNAFARLDGFKDAAALIAWFRKQHGPARFEGWCCGWGKLP